MHDLKIPWNQSKFKRAFSRIFCSKVVRALVLTIPQTIVRLFSLWFHSWRKQSVNSQCLTFFQAESHSLEQSGIPEVVHSIGSWWANSVMIGSDGSWSNSIHWHGFHTRSFWKMSVFFSEFVIRIQSCDSVAELVNKVHNC